MSHNNEERLSASATLAIEEMANTLEVSPDVIERALCSIAKAFGVPREMLDGPARSALAAALRESNQ